MAQREKDYQTVRALNAGKLTDSEERSAFAKLESVAAFLAERHMNGTLNNIISIGEKLQAGRFNCFLCNNIESFFGHSEDIEALPQEVLSWHGMYKDSFTRILSEPYRRLLSAMKARYAFEIPGIEHPAPLNYLRQTRDNAHGASDPGFLAPGTHTAPRLRGGAGGFDPYRPWSSPSK